MAYQLKIIFDRFEKDKAVLLTPFGQEIFWPAGDFSNRVEPGKSFYLTLRHQDEKIKQNHPKITTKPQNFSEDKEKESLAKKMLEELLNQSGQKT